MCYISGFENCCSRNSGKDKCKRVWEQGSSPKNRDADSYIKIYINI